MGDPGAGDRHEAVQRHTREWRGAATAAPFPRPRAPARILLLSNCSSSTAAGMRIHQGQGVAAWRGGVPWCVVVVVPARLQVGDRSRSSVAMLLGVVGVPSLSIKKSADGGSPTLCFHWFTPVFCSAFVAPYAAHSPDQLPPPPSSSPFPLMGLRSWEPASIRGRV